MCGVRVCGVCVRARARARNENPLMECDRPEERRSLPVGSIKAGGFPEWLIDS